ncbi:IclR family transcriptional regulator [Variovorax sp. HJSM1_2]|uniref:IclR family transcriptional regulator n=1 Tax=Variovorax sp. HJSM1_2 TaxID=3366263 RepID=UPI003BDE90F1
MSSSKPPRATPSAVPTADRVLQVLAVLAQQGRTMAAPELMEHTGLARSTLYRQLARLKRWGFVLERDGQYAPGPVSLQLALGFDLASHLVPLARPAMTELCQQARESVGLIVAVNDQAICLDMVETSQSLRCSFEKGRSVPLRLGASAKCLLAHLPEDRRDALLDTHYGAHSPARAAALQELVSIRNTGYAVSQSEVDPGVWGCSVPLFRTPRQSVGAITLMAPILRAQDQASALIHMTVVAAARISRELTPP